MIPILRTKISISLFMLVLFPVLFTFAAVTASYADNAEETAEMITPDDSILIGKMTYVSKTAVDVDHFRQRFCGKVKIFSPRNQMMSIDELDGAEEVKLFVNDRCVRKIVVLRFAQ